MTDAAAEGMLPWLRLYGRGTLSYLLRYEANWNFFHHDSGVVPWLVGPKTAIAWTDPLCAETDVPNILAEYTQYMRREQRAVCLFVVGEATARSARQLGYSAVRIGQEPWFDLATWELPRGNRGKGIRWSLNHARREDIEIIEYCPGNGRSAMMDAHIVDVMDRWRRAFPRRITESLLRSSPLDAADDKRIFIAMSRDRAVAFVSCCPIYGKGGFYFEDLIRAPDSVNGTSELLVVESLQRMRESGVARAALSIAPFRGSDPQMDPRARLIWPIIMFGVRHMKARYNFESLMRFAERFNPTSWEDRYVAFYPAIPRPRIISAILRSV